jgi:hypothetical protein
VTYFYLTDQLARRLIADIGPKILHDRALRVWFDKAGISARREHSGPHKIAALKRAVSYYF